MKKRNKERKKKGKKQRIANENESGRIKYMKKRKKERTKLTAYFHAKRILSFTQDMKLIKIIIIIITNIFRACLCLTRDPHFALIVKDILT